MKLILSHPGIGELVVALGEGGLTVGRQGGSADLEMNWDGRVSRRHARFWVEDGGVWLQDLESRNGTWLDTVRLEGPLRLEPGMRVAVGETWFWLAEAPKVEVAPAEVATPPAASESAFEIIIEDALERTLEAYEPETDEVKNTTELPAMRKPPARALPVPQLVGDNEVVLRTDREGLAALWIESLSKGALFVPTDRPPLGRATMNVRLETSGGGLGLSAEVVHVVDARGGVALGLSPGIGLHITDLTAENRAAIHRFATGQVERLEPPRAPAGSGPTRPARGVDIEPELLRAREFITRVEANDLYAALAVSNSATDGELKKRIGELKSAFAAAQAHATPPQLTRLGGAVRLLERAAITLGDPIRRLEYDFRRGDVRAEERMTRAKDGTGAGLPALREAWVRSFPQDVDAAAALAKKAATAKRSRELLLAIETMRAAVRLDPFHEELRETVRAWERTLPQHKAT